MNNSDNLSARHPKAYVSTIGITQLHLRNPYAAAFWSLAFPGFGHILTHKYIEGILLFLLEILINLEANVNLAILYSFTGRFQLAKSVIHKEWILLYVPTYMFAIWDSFRAAVTINNIYKLACREDAEINPIKIDGMGFNYLDKRSPWVAAAWTALMPGTGQLYLHRIVNAFLY